MADLLLQEGDTLLFTGDSITDGGRDRPIGSGLAGGLGSSYPELLAAMLALDYPDLDPAILNTANSGDTSSQLRSRWEEAVLRLPREIVVLLIGVNDVWRSFDYYGEPAAPSSSHSYRDTLEYFVGSLRDGRTTRLLLLTPFFLELHRDDPFRALVDEYAQQARVVAARYPGFVRLIDPAAHL